MICEKCKNRIFDHVCIDMCEEEVCPNRYTKKGANKERIRLAKKENVRQITERK